MQGFDSSDQGAMQAMHLLIAITDTQPILIHSQF